MTRSKVTWIRVCALALAVSAAGPLFGQSYDQLAPKPVREGAAPLAAQPAAPAGPAASADDSTVLLPSLSGIALIPSAERLNKGGAGQGGVAVDGLSWLNRGAVESLAHGFLSRPLTKGALAKLVQGLVLLSRQENHPVVEVYAPPQDISSGVVQIVVLVARVGQVKVEGNKWFSTEDLARQVRIKPGDEITGDSLVEDLDWLNQNPFRQVDLVYARGQGPGQTDVILRVADEPPERVYAGYDDTGNEATGLGRVYTGFNLGDLWGDDNQLNYQYTRSTDWKLLQAHSASYSVPLPNRDTVSVFGSWARADSITGGIFDLQGINWQVGTRYNIPLPSLPGDTQTLSFGADYKWSNNNLGFGGTQIFTSPANIAQGVLSYSGSVKDAQGTTSGSLTGYYSPGGIGGLNHDHDFVVQRAGAKADYGYLTATLGRVQELPQDFTLGLTVTGQVASARLLSSEEFGLGGADSVRGYDERIANGDNGISGQLELRTPSRQLSAQLQDRTQALVFVDAGRDWQKDPMQGDVNTTLASAGPGIRVQLGSHGSLKADYGWELDRLKGTHTGRIHLSAVVSF